MDKPTYDMVCKALGSTEDMNEKDSSQWFELCSSTDNVCGTTVLFGTVTMAPGIAYCLLCSHIPVYMREFRFTCVFFQRYPVQY